MTVLLGSMLISASAIWTALRIPKSPHPGHQSLCASVLSSESLSATGQDHLLGSIPFRDKLDSLVDLLRGHRAAVVLHDVLLYRDARPLPDQPPELTRVVHLDVDDLHRLREDLLDVLRGERMDQPDLEEVHYDSVLLEPLHRVEDRALSAQHRPGRNARRGGLESVELSSLGGLERALQESPSLYLHLVDVVRWKSDVRVGERLVNQMNHGGLIPLCIVEYPHGVVEGFLEVSAREDESWELAVSRVKSEPQVALLVPRRKARARPSPLVEGDHNGHLIDPRPAQPLRHEGEARTGCRCRGPHTREPAPDRHRYRGYLVLRLDYGDRTLVPEQLRLPHLRILERGGPVEVDRLASLQELTLIARRRDRVVGLKPAPRQLLGYPNGAVPPHEESLLVRLYRLKLVAEAAVVLRPDEVVGRTYRPRVHLRRLRLRLELAPDCLLDCLFFVAEERERGGDGHHVDHPREAAQGAFTELLSHLLEYLQVGDGEDVDAPPPRQLDNVLHLGAEAVRAQLLGQEVLRGRLDGGDVLHLVVLQVGVVDDRTVLPHLERVPREGLVVEGREHVYCIDVGPQDLLAESNLKVTVLTLDVGVVFPLAKDVEPPRSGGPSEDVRGGIDPAALSTSNHPGEVVSLQIRTVL